MFKRKTSYFVSYMYENKKDSLDYTGYADIEVEAEGKIKSMDDINDIRALIRNEFDYKEVIILNFKRL